MVRQLHIVCYICALVGIIYVFESASVQAVDVTTLVTISICGDGLVQGGPEVCDEGPGGNLGGYSSTTAGRTCNPGCESFGAYCGDNILQVRFLEECDDGNETNGDLCDLTCQSETPVPPGGAGSPTVGSIPNNPTVPPGTIQSSIETRVVLRGKAYPNSDVSILIDGKVTDVVRADSRADFVYSTAAVTPGTATFGFSAKDRNGIQALTTSVVFEVVQSAVTTVANVFFPPTLSVTPRQATPGSPITISGQTIPDARVVTLINPGGATKLDARSDSQGVWVLQLDTASISEGPHSAKAYFEVSDLIRSGYGRAVSFSIGEGEGGGNLGPDLNGDGKVNLVDFSIFLISWNTDNERPDFNVDGTVNLADFSIMLFSWTG